MIFKTFAERKRLQERSDEPDVYTYDQAPPQLRHQIGMAIAEGIGSYYVPGYGATPPNANREWGGIDHTCHKEIFSYTNAASGRNGNIAEKFRNYLIDVQSVDDFLSAVEIACIYLDGVDAIYRAKGSRGARQNGKDALEEINGRFIQHSVGYQFENMHLIRIDSQIAHAEIIKPALNLLTAAIFGKANDDFMTAHRHYRAGEYKDCVTSANRAYESMLKAICDKEGWAYGKGDRAAELVTLVTNQGLFTHDFDKSFTAYVAMMKAGLPAVRNDAGGHGGGLRAEAVGPHIARFALNLTASNLLFLGEAYATMKQRGSTTPKQA